MESEPRPALLPELDCLPISRRAINIAHLLTYQTLSIYASPKDTNFA